MTRAYLSHPYCFGAGFMLLITVIQAEDGITVVEVTKNYLLCSVVEGILGLDAVECRKKELLSIQARSHTTLMCAFAHTLVPS